MSDHEEPTERTLDYLPVDQLAILAALDPYERASLPLLVDITGIRVDDVDGHLEELRNLGLVQLHKEPEPLTMRMAVSLTGHGRALIRTRIPNSSHRLGRAMGFPFKTEGGAR